MTLYINTTSPTEIIIALRLGQKLVASKKIKTGRAQAEKLLLAIDKLLQAQKLKLKALKKIVVANRGSSFTSLRIGVITANALAYALKIPVEAEPKIGAKLKNFSFYSIVEPMYDREPNIGLSKKPKL